jgi:hypothetical protein
MQSQHNIVDSHRNMLMVSKNLSDFQTENLRQWPMIFFNYVERVQVEYSFLDTDGNFFAGNVTFNITIKGPVGDIVSPAMHLEAATKLMFWSDTNVVIKINGELWNKKKTQSKNTKKTSPKKKGKPSKSL